jgi:hypothetical protein
MFLANCIDAVARAKALLEKDRTVVNGVFCRLSIAERSAAVSLTPL